MKGHIKLLTTFVGIRFIPMKFLIIEQESPYNAILERPSLNKIGAIVSKPHLAIKFPFLIASWPSFKQMKRRLDNVMSIT